MTAPTAAQQPTGSSAPRRAPGAAPDPAADPARGLTPAESALLDFADLWWRRDSNRDEAIAGRLGLTPAQYFTRLNALLDDPRAFAARPATISRLQRVRAGRAARRGGRG